MKIGLICNDDYANFQYNLTEALKGYDVKSLKLVRHPFNYPDQVKNVDYSEAYQELEDRDIIIACHSFHLKLPNKIIIPYHTGTAYRQSPQYYNDHFKNSPFALIALPEFQFTCSNYKYLVGCVDTDKLIPSPTNSDRTIYAHYPSNPDVKGSSRIIEVMKQMNVDFRYSKDRVNYKEHIERLKGCDVYIEMLADKQGDKPYGSFGMTALEAAALGKVVITQNVNDAGLYSRTYGFYSFVPIKDENELRENVNFFNKKEYAFGLSRDWVVRNHSLKATGERLINYLNEL